MLTKLSIKLKSIGNSLAVVERAVCGLLIGAFTLLLMFNVLSRYLFNAPLFFAEELALSILVWMGYLAIAYSVSRDRQIGMGLVVDKLPEQSKRIVLIVVNIIMLAISCSLLWSTVQWLQSSSVSYERAIAMDLPKWPFYLVMPVFWSVLIIHLLEQLVSKLAVVTEEV